MTHTEMKIYLRKPVIQNLKLDDEEETREDDLTVDASRLESCVHQTTP
ncbi:hypothetical protein LINPERPRIM_LOCUS1996 [Linum perenne]